MGDRADYLGMLHACEPSPAQWRSAADALREHAAKFDGYAERAQGEVSSIEVEHEGCTYSTVLHHIESGFWLCTKCGASGHIDTSETSP